MKNKILAVIAGWLIFIGIDFVFHGSLFAHLWREEIDAFKSLENLALLIPAGYMSFLLLTILQAYIYFQLFSTHRERKALLKFSLTFSFLYSLSGFLGMYSFLTVPIKHLLIFHSIYFIELLSVPFVIDHVAHSASALKIFGRIVLLFFLLIIIGILFQNMM